MSANPFQNEILLKRDGQLLQIVDASLADASARSGEHLYCHPGCTQCCHGAFAINALDALRLRTAMTSLTATDPALAARIRGRAESYLTVFGPTFPGNRTDGILDTSEEAQQAFDDFANEAACPALNPDTGLCDLYEARPIACRVFGPPVRLGSERTQDQSGQAPSPAFQIEQDEDPRLDFAVCELCFTDATTEEVEAAEMHVPREEELQLLDDLEGEPTSKGAETIVAFCLIQSLSQDKLTAS